MQARQTWLTWWRVLEQHLLIIVSCLRPKWSGLYILLWPSHQMWAALRRVYQSLQANLCRWRKTRRSGQLEAVCWLPSQKLGNKSFPSIVIWVSHHHVYHICCTWIQLRGLPNNCYILLSSFCSCWIIFKHQIIKGWIWSVDRYHMQGLISSFQLFTYLHIFIFCCLFIIL